MSHSRQKRPERLAYHLGMARWLERLGHLALSQWHRECAYELSAAIPGQSNT